MENWALANIYKYIFITGAQFFRAPFAEVQFARETANRATENEGFNLPGLRREDPGFAGAQFAWKPLTPGMSSWAIVSHPGSIWVIFDPAGVKNDRPGDDGTLRSV